MAASDTCSWARSGTCASMRRGPGCNGMARPVFWRAGAAKDAVPRLAHLDQDRPLVQGAQRDPAQFDALYRRYLARVDSYAYYEVGDHHAAEDATQRTFLPPPPKLHPSPERARPPHAAGSRALPCWRLPAT